jgi:hypothetical protein
MRSNEAFILLCRDLEMPRRLLSLETNHFRDPPSAEDLVVVMGLRRAVAILTVAAFEAFLKDEFTRCIDAISGKVTDLTFGRLPEPLRIANTFNPLDGALRGPRHGLPRGKVHRLSDIKRVASSIHSDKLMPEAFGQGKGNPSSACVKEICEEVGMKDVFGKIRGRFERKWGTPVSHSFIPDKLEEIVQRRHRLAHGVRGLVFSRKDLREGLRFTRVLCDVVDIEVRQHFREMRRVLR